MSRAAGAIAAAILVVLATPAGAARLPDWAGPIADNAPEVPEGIAGENSRTLLRETHIEVGDDGTFRIRQRRATQALRASAGEVGLGWFHFVEGTRILRSRGWHLPPEGRAKKSAREELDLKLDDAFLSDRRTRVVHVAGIEKGSLVFFEFEAETVPDVLAWQELFFEGTAADLVRLEIETPPGWSVRHAWLRESGPDPTVSGSLHTWEIRNLPAPRGLDESLSGSAADAAPLLVVGLAPPEGTTVQPAVFRDWTALGAWYETLAAGRDAVTDEVAEAARQAGVASEGSWEDRVRAGARWVRDRVRYIANELGPGAYRPRPAGDVLRQLHGDCKDKVTLLRAMLATGGIESHPILVNATSRETVSEEIPSPTAFNHVVLGIPVPDGASAPAGWPVVDAGDLGSLVVVDVTDETTSVGWLPAGLEGRTGVVIAGDASRLVELPRGDAETHRIETAMDAAIGADGSVALSLETRRYGEPASVARQEYRGSVQDYRKNREAAIRRLWPEAGVEDWSAEDEAGDGAFVETVRVGLPSLSATDTAGLLAVFPGAVEELPRVSLGRRESAVVYPCALTLRYVTSVGGPFAAAYALPEGRDETGDGWSVRASYALEGESLRARWELVLSRERFPPPELRELRRFWSAARRCSATTVSRRGPDR